MIDEAACKAALNKLPALEKFEFDLESVTREAGLRKHFKQLRSKRLSSGGSAKEK